MNAVQPQKQRGNIFLSMHPLHRILLSGVLSAVTLFFIPENTDALLKTLIAWIVFTLVYLITSWIVLYTRPIPQIRKFAQKDDGSKWFVFVMILLASFSSLIIVLLLMMSKEAEKQSHFLFVFASIAGILLSWFLVHTTYTFHYAHMFYDNLPDDNSQDAEGLEFPGDEPPDYIDFAYFAFVIGCCFQVSDVEISSRTIRRSVLWHQLLSFGMNTFVVALTINLVAGLMK